jgi:hypothetical protein
VVYSNVQMVPGAQLLLWRVKFQGVPQHHVFCCIAKGTRADAQHAMLYLSCLAVDYISAGPSDGSPKGSKQGSEHGLTGGLGAAQCSNKREVPQQMQVSSWLLPAVTWSWLCLLHTCQGRRVSCLSM